MAESSSRTPTTPIGALLVERRLQAKLTQEALAERAGLGVRSIQAIERGESRPRRETVRQLARALGLDEAQSAELVELAQPAPRTRRLVWPDQAESVDGFDLRARSTRSVSQREPSSAPSTRENPTASPGLTPHNLQPSLTSFVGREREIAEVRRLLGTTRLLTLTGSGGCGKTRLALQVAEGLTQGSADEYSDGVWLVELAPLSDPALVLLTAAASLGLRQESGSDPLDTLTDHLRPRRTLLVLDNCEHLIDASAQLAECLLRACPKLRVLATSRQPLEITGETTYRIPSLSLPDLQELPSLEQLAECESVRLFAERARAVQQRFALSSSNARFVAEIVVRIDGIPLAIELAAALVRGLTVEQIARRLDDRFRLLTSGSRTALPRQQTLRATIDWSHDLLSEPERVLFRRLAVFQGGFSLEAAEAVCSDEAAGAATTVERAEVLELLLHLVDRSLVVAVGETGEGPSSVVQQEETPNSPRFSMLETVRLYGQERLGLSGEADAIRERHAERFLGLAEDAEAAVVKAEEFHQGYAPRGWLAGLARDEDNFRAAHDWAIEREHQTLALRLGAAVWRFWYFRGNLSEGRQHLSQALHLPAPSPRDEVYLRARVLGLEATARLAHFQHDHAAASAFLGEALALAHELGDPTRIVAVLQAMGLSALLDGDLAAAAGHLDRGLSYAEALGQSRLAARTLLYRGLVAQYQDDLSSARALLEASAALQRSEDKRPDTDTLAALGFLLMDQGDAAGARAAFGELVTICLSAGQRRSLGTAKCALASIAHAAGDLGTARSSLEDGLLTWHSAGQWGGSALIIAFAAEWAVAQGYREQARWLTAAAWELWRRGGTPMAACLQARLAYLLRWLQALLGLSVEAMPPPTDSVTWESALAYALETLRKEEPSAEPRNSGRPR